MLHLAPDPSAEAEADAADALAQIAAATPDAVAQVALALAAYAAAGLPVAGLVARLAAERNGLRAQLDALRDRSSLYSENDSENENDDIENDAAVPSKRRVRKSILSALSVSVVAHSDDSLALPNSYILGAVTTTPISPKQSFAVAPRGSSKGTALSPITPSSPENPSANVTPPSPLDQLPSPTPPRQSRPSSSSLEGNNLVIPKRGQSTAASARLSTAIPLSDSMTIITEEVGTTETEESQQVVQQQQPSASTPPITARGSSATTTDSVPPVLLPRDGSFTSTTDASSSSDAIVFVHMEGFLVKKMNNTPFASEGGSGWGWKPRYFRLKDSVLEECDSKTHSKITSIQLKHNTTVTIIQTSPQNSSAGVAHAFTITEHKHSMPAPVTVRHTLCTHAQGDRDAWVEAINSRIQAAASSSAASSSRRMRRPSEGHLRVERPERTIATERSERQDSLDGGGNTATSPKLTPQQLALQHQMLQSPGQANRTAINLLQEGGSAAVGVARRGFNMFLGGSQKIKKDAPRIVDPDRVIFGAPLERGVALSQLDPSIALSSVVSRCIEFLESKDGIKEEGIYRLSGATTLIQTLKQHFDLDGDLNLLKLGETEIIDFHAVTGLLKLYLRELPDSLLGEGELKKELMKLASLPGERADKVKELVRLLPQLPEVNYTLLKRLSAHLNLVIQYREVNKMTMSNLSIVFSPTLGVPGGLFQVMVLDNEAVFGV
ncbi:hypothetical protein BDR26DRAFT_918458 [Obelidium mucronatum]|nr:hypothetical protein BDR26DRAFT_918458 [Obelidium mucronatum]